MRKYYGCVIFLGTFLTLLAQAQAPVIYDHGGMFIAKFHRPDGSAVDFPLWHEIAYPSPLGISEHRPPNLKYPPNGIVILQHGLRENLLARHQLISRFTSQGFLVAGFDLPGHGGSPNLDLETFAPKIFNGGPFNQKDGLLHDIADLANTLILYTRLIQSHALSAYGLESIPPTILYGHSVGGAIAWDAVLYEAEARSRDSSLKPLFAGAVLSAPAVGLFLHQRPIAPVLNLIGKNLPTLPVFPLPTPLFARRWLFSKTQRPGYHDEWLEQTWDKFKSAKLNLAEGSAERLIMGRSESPYFHRRTNRGWLHPAQTARAIIMRNRSREAEMLQNENKSTAPYPIVLLHDQGDAITDPRSSSSLLSHLPGGGDRVFLPGAIPHGDVSDPFYKAHLSNIIKSMVDGDFHHSSTFEPDPRNYRRPRLRVIDKIARCAGLLTRAILRTPKYGKIR